MRSIYIYLNSGDADCLRFFHNIPWAARSLFHGSPHPLLLPPLGAKCFSLYWTHILIKRSSSLVLMVTDNKDDFRSCVLQTSNVLEYNKTFLWSNSSDSHYLIKTKRIMMSWTNIIKGAPPPYDRNT